MGWMEELQSRIGDRVRKARKEKVLTQARLAELANLPTETVNRIERGAEPNPTLRVLHSIAQALDLEIHELFLPEREYEIVQTRKSAGEVRESLDGLGRYDLNLIRTLSERIRNLSTSRKGGR